MFDYEMNVRVESAPGLVHLSIKTGGTRQTVTMSPDQAKVLSYSIGHFGHGKTEGNGAIRNRMVCVYAGGPDSVLVDILGGEPRCVFAHTEESRHALVNALHAAANAAENKG